MVYFSLLTSLRASSLDHGGSINSGDFWCTTHGLATRTAAYALSPLQRVAKQQGGRLQLRVTPQAQCGRVKLTVQYLVLISNPCTGEANEIVQTSMSPEIQPWVMLALLQGPFLKQCNLG